MFFQKPTVLSVITGVMIIILTATAFARKTFTGYSFNGAPSAHNSNSKVFSAGFSVIASKGTMGNGLTDAPDRDLYFYPAQLFMGIRLWQIRISAMAEYMQSSQITDAAEVANTNVGGTGIAFGPRLDYYNGKQSLGVFYRASHSYQLEKTDINNTQQEYTAKGGYTVQYIHRLRGKLGLVLDYTQEEFSESLSTAPVKWNRAGIGLVFSNFD